MGLFSSKPADDKAAQDKAVAEYKKAKKALDANSERERKAGIRDETPSCKGGRRIQGGGGIHRDCGRCGATGRMRRWGAGKEK